MRPAVPGGDGGFEPDWASQPEGPAGPPSEGGWELMASGSSWRSAAALRRSGASSAPSASSWSVLKMVMSDGEAQAPRALGGGTWGSHGCSGGGPMCSGGSAWFAAVSGGGAWFVAVDSSGGSLSTRASSWCSAVCRRNSRSTDAASTLSPPCTSSSGGAGDGCEVDDCDVVPARSRLLHAGVDGQLSMS